MQPAQRTGDPPIPRFAKTHTANSGEEVNAVWLHSELNHEVLFQEILAIKSNSSEPKRIEDAHDFFSIIRVASHENINIACITGARMKTYGPRTHNQIVNSLAIQQVDKLAQIFR